MCVNALQETNPAMHIPFGFAGGIHDRATGLVKYRFRDYMPDVGRFTAKDPIGYRGGDADLSGYCLDDPVNGIDPEGLSYLVYDSSQGQLILMGDDMLEVGRWEAANNPDTGLAPYPAGSFRFSWWNPHPESGVNDKFGSYGNFIFDVPGREGMGVHSGRADSGGIEHGTKGCIRTIDDATRVIRDAHLEGEGLTTLFVRGVRPPDDGGITPPEGYGR